MIVLPLSAVNVRVETFASAVASSKVPRITSYNVCYTKLLRITIPYSSELYPASTVSVKMWIASEDWSTVKTFFSNTQTGGYGARINHDTDEIYFLARLNGTYCTAACTYSEQNLGTASHFAGTCDGRYVKLYINGELVASADAGAYYTSYNFV